MREIAGKSIPDTLEEVADPRRTALLLWDMEYAIAPNAFNFIEIVPNLKGLADLAHKVGVPVFYSQQIAFDLDKEEAEVWMRVRQKRMTAGGTSQGSKTPSGKHGHDIIEELKPQPGDIVFQKRRPDGFIGTDLDLLLRNKGIRTVVIGGVATEGGVEGTARTGRNLGYYMVVLKDGSGSRNRESHDLALKLMERTDFDVVTARQVEEVWRHSP